MAALIQGLQMIYDRAGRTSNWHVGSDGSASGNPLRGNVDIARLRKNHPAKLVNVGRTSKRATPITEEHICRHFSLMMDLTTESDGKIPGFQGLGPACYLGGGPTLRPEI
jgi:hypothetical protein